MDKKKQPLVLPPGARVLVTGGTGFTGKVVMQKLAHMGVTLRAIKRTANVIEELKDLEVDWITGNVFDPDVVEKAARDVEYIIHVAACFRDPKAGEEEMYKVHVESTKLLAEAALKQSTFKRFVHISTVGVHSEIEDPPADENYRFKPGDSYQKTKAEGEIWLKEFSEANNLPFVIIRPAMIYGPGDKRLLKFFKLSASGYFPLIGKGNRIFNFIHVEDLADFFIHAAVHPRALNEIFICGNPSDTSLQSMALCVAQTLHKRVRFISLPAWPFFLAADLCEAVCKPFKIAPPIYHRRVAFFTKDRSFNTQKMQTVVEFTPHISTEEGFRTTTLWYKEHGWL